MQASVQSFFASLKGKKIALCGIGISNTPLIYKFLDYGAQVTACDRRDRVLLGAAADELEAAGAALSLGEGYLDNLDAEIIFRTPGMNYNLPELKSARSRGVIVTSEMEVFFDLCPATLIAVTGSDGKTTTTTLISEMLKAQGKRVFLGGNIGRPLLPEIEKMRPGDYAAVELSSFQLISMRRSPQVAVITNIAPNHLDVHRDMDEYVDAKKNIILHQNAFSRAVLNADNPLTRSLADQTRGQTLLFSRLRPLEAGAYLDGDSVMMALQGRAEKVMERGDIRLPGVHNLENYLAAITAVWGYAEIPAIKKVAREFAGVPHRIEYVRTVGGVKYYNDSIATSPTRTIAGLGAFDQRLIVIAGGYDKRIPFEPLAGPVCEKVKLLILTGATSGKIEAAVKSHPAYDPLVTRIVYAQDLPDAVRIAHETAIDGDIVTLSPACASFDKYKNFEARGSHFKELVAAL
ncbi:MAG TPA: UDP-N-acetylmuramoyl-L-alanine--D-glutamate ligase [Ruminococcaceae bacterium]|nr:UDP-N-acetylmuramoyl-L-alanine--D-glutamate ligase [Oscillospiraceae bacterium]